MLTGSCLCGGVTFTATATAKDPAACHCTQCRKQSGHIWASVQVPLSAFEMQGDVRWFEASDTAKRGFCPTCGSSLFWKSHAEDEIGVAMGALDAPTGLTLTRHIFTEDKGDYYQIPPAQDPDA
ncbi:GFA family protein [Pseudosulfitobacter pseudonitzschiae]|uniref:GFA family protein n=1 Tax=Pseudosulfitobacter pseudonitzschiae TaxID=1402135 RepID=UPI001AF1F23E|nr:GFA family protein [Pseudosulfitobacter pseudonitzschiae]MBM1815859.1 GFA family protein [Pseudosulfitobacter pseudonitzschiae]MBM1832850.1 GFA family protein [Pseudosulfitobacter pseudonitzschiae]MBM1837718.1 GFA family protein [Pseudosulfitobacter pseudonitzschiae]MBM1842564.1 GFA family protein [Pseudosulfitobacter pseudonitzschiae]MBM1847432.1 GFA family protein [Pseudosulfitobacter pseudonitzschiae]